MSISGSKGQSSDTQFLHSGDSFLRSGDIERAIQSYLRYCEHIERLEPDRESLLCNTRLITVRKRILALDPLRRDVRQALAGNYIALGLLDEAKVELLRVTFEADAARDPSSAREARDLLDWLSSRQPGRR